MYTYNGTLSVQTHSVVAVPFEDILDGSTRDVLHKDVDHSVVHTCTKVAHNILVTETPQNTHLHLQLLKLLQTARNRVQW